MVTKMITCVLSPLWASLISFLSFYLHFIAHHICKKVFFWFCFFFSVHDQICFQNLVYSRSLLGLHKASEHCHICVLGRVKVRWAYPNALGNAGLSRQVLGTVCKGHYRMHSAWSPETLYYLSHLLVSLFKHPSTDKWKKKLCVCVCTCAHVHNGILFNHKKEWNPGICSNMDGTTGHYIR